ncbi:MAG: 3-deoxy-8-phosphooctulonate synthase [Legionella longbeachae]|nr:3-deoxy-8-phosphooctulonate synthase [Legionella longbeachae]
MKLCGFEVGLNQPFFLIAGPCVIESEELALETAGYLKELCSQLHIPFIYKSSFDKANRSSISSYRGPGFEKGLSILEKVKTQIGVPVLTDVHEDTPLLEVSSVVDVLQTPAQIMACERGVSFGYNNLVSDMRSLAIMRETGCPVVYDATHSVQLPGGNNGASGGQREFIPILARAAVAAGISGLFMETHPDPDNALSDGPNSWPLAKIKPLLESLKALDAVYKSSGEIE